MGKIKKYILEIVLVFLFIVADIGIVFVMQEKIDANSRKSNIRVSEQNDIKQAQEKETNQENETNNKGVEEKKDNYNTETSQSNVSPREENIRSESKENPEVVIELSEDCLINESFGEYYELGGKFDDAFIKKYIIDRKFQEIDPNGVLKNDYNKEEYINIYKSNYKIEDSYEDFMKIQIAINTLACKKKYTNYGCTFGQEAERLYIWNYYFNQFSWFEQNNDTAKTKQSEFEEEFGMGNWEYKLYKELASYRGEHF